MKRRTGLALLLAIAMPIAAHAGPVLPDLAPIPAAKPSQVRAVPAVAPLPPVVITTEPMPIPEARLDVRVVGSRFLPPLSENIDFRDDPAEGEIEMLARSVEWLLSTAANRMMEDTIVEPPQQTAAVEKERISVVIGAVAE